MGFDLVIALAFFVAAFVFIFLMLFVGWILRPANPQAPKSEIYECGEHPIGSAWFQFNPRFYIVALIFLIFDVEVVFVFPVATIYKQAVADGRGVLAFLELGLFMVLLLIGLAYVWKKQDLEWLKRV